METTADSRVVHEPWPFRTCPDCGHTDFLAHNMDGSVVFTCLGCASAWRYSLGYLIKIEGRVDVSPEPG